MNPHEPPARPHLRRDPLGLAGLFPEGSAGVPLSDFDGGEIFGEAPAREGAGSCSSCEQRCPAEALVRLRILDCGSGGKP